MSVVINTNTAATVANNNLSASNALLQRSLNRLSSGLKIVQPSDDAGGLAVSMKLEAAMKRTDAVSTNVANAISFLQTQDGALKTAGKVLNRISELKTLSEDVTKSSSDVANYQVEFAALQSQLTSLAAEKFNGVALFGGAAATLEVATSEDGAQTFDITQANLAGNVTAVTGAADLGALTIANVTGALEAVATSRAQNGAESSRLNFSADLLVNNRTNLEAANSRIIDVDVAQESTQLARYSILVQAGTAMLAQANASSQVALRLLS